MSTQKTKIGKNRRLAGMGEFEILKGIQGLIPKPGRNTVVGIGDDAAVVRPNPRALMVSTTDSLIEGVHFIRQRLNRQALGYKSVLVNASDIVAMGGKPTYGLVSLALPGDTTWPEVEEFYTGLLRGFEVVGAELIGGDLDQADRIIINLSMMGEVSPRHILRQNGAKPGQTIYVTGTLGDSAAALPIATARRKRKLRPEEEILLHRHYHPPYLYDAMQTIRRVWKPTAVTDVSDGFSRDLEKICLASGTGAHVDLEKLPISVECFLASERMNLDPRILAATGGEDYQLLFTSDRSPEKSPPGAGDVTVCAVGQILKTPGKPDYRLCGKPIYPAGGFDHFKK